MTAGKAMGADQAALDEKYALRTPKGVEKLLRDKYYLLSRAYTRGDMAAVDILIDSEIAIERGGLTEKQRATIDLLYEKDYDQKQAAKVLNVDSSTLSRNKQAAIKKIARVFDEWNYN